MMFGVAFLALGCVVGISLALLDVPRLWRLPIFLPLWMGATGVMQAREKTCVALAKSGQQNMDSGIERVIEAATLRQHQAQARRVHSKSLVLAAVLSAALVAIP